MLRKLGHSGFTYQVMITDQDLPNDTEDVFGDRVLYYKVTSKEKELDDAVNQEIDQLYQEILQLWQANS
jgi:hypothetical protein